MAQKPNIPQPSTKLPFAARIWHWRAKRYLYASDYGIKGFPIGRR